MACVRDRLRALFLSHVVFQAFLVTAGCVSAASAEATVLAGPIVNPANGHSYYLLDSASWTNSEAEAQTLGGHLVTINDQAEHDWVYSTFSTFGGTDRTLYVGLTDAAFQGAFVWVSGEPVTFTRWAPGEPNGGVSEDYVYIYPPGQPRAGFWNDSVDDSTPFPCGSPCSYHGVVEVAPPIVSPSATPTDTVDPTATPTATGTPTPTATPLLCDFSPAPGEARCFGGIGPGCDGISFLPNIPFRKDAATCIVDGWASGGSILHDNCCYVTRTLLGFTGYCCGDQLACFLNEANVSETMTACKREWKVAREDVECGRAWRQEFGPYRSGMPLADPPFQISAPPGAPIDWKYSDLCGSGGCMLNDKGKILVYKDKHTGCSYCRCR